MVITALQHSAIGTLVGNHDYDVIDASAIPGVYNPLHVAAADEASFRGFLIDGNGKWMGMSRASYLSLVRCTEEAC